MTNLLRDLPLRKIGHLCEPQTLPIGTKGSSAPLAGKFLRDHWIVPVTGGAHPS